MGCTGVRAPWNTFRAEVYVVPLQLRRVGSEPYLAWKSLPLEETPTPPGHAFRWKRPPISWRAFVPLEKEPERVRARPSTGGDPNIGYLRPL